MTGYVPTPIDTSAVELPASIQKLIELLAENTHDIWAAQRIAEGWTYGAQRNDERKEHPGLVPYADLADSEREYDRNTAVESLKLIIALGYRISDTPNEESP